jgi:hypothetical protein
MSVPRLPGLPIAWSDIDEIWYTSSLNQDTSILGIWDPKVGRAPRYDLSKHYDSPIQLPRISIQIHMRGNKSIVLFETFKMNHSLILFFRVIDRFYNSVTSFFRYMYLGIRRVDSQTYIRRVDSFISVLIHNYVLRRVTHS